MLLRILYMGNNWVGWQILKWLRDQDENIVGLVMHPPEKRKYGNELLEVANISSECIFDGALLKKPNIFEAIRALKPDLGLSILFDYIFNEEFLSLFRDGVINLHPSFLPFNRGQYPNVWSIVEGTPSGVTLHYIDKGVDTGDIIAQKCTPVEPIDTGKTLYQKLEGTSVDLFTETWPLIKSGRAKRSKQYGSEPGTFHRTRDVESIDEIHLDQTYKARDLINVLRARTFDPYKGAYFYEGERRIYLKLQLAYGEDAMD